MTIVDLCSDVKSGKVDGFDLSNSLEAMISESEIKSGDLNELIPAIASRCTQDPQFRQDLIDFDVIKPLLQRMHALESSLIPPLVGTSGDMKAILRETGIVDNLVQALESALKTPGAIDPDLCSALITVTTSCNDNKIVFLRHKELLPDILSRLADCVHAGLFKVLNAIIVDDDRESKMPASVFARESLVDGENKNLLLQALRIHSKSPDWDRASVFTFVREVSMSQDLSKQFALEEGFLIKAMEAMSSCSECEIHAVAKYLRQLAFADEMKADVLVALVRTDDVMEKWIEASKKDKRLSKDLLGTLANLSLKNPEHAREIIGRFPKMISLCHHVLSGSHQADNELTQCLQFMRCMLKFDEGIELLHSQFESDIETLKVSCNDKTISRISDEILSKISSAHVKDE